MMMMMMMMIIIIIIIIMSFRKYVSNILGKHEVKELQQTATLGTAHTLRKVLM
jgi:predicted Holliday junction resolvase-like endonuclease